MTQAHENPGVQAALVSALEDPSCRALVPIHRHVRLGHDVAAQADAPCIAIVRDGVAALSFEAPDGRRQIMAFLLPGDPYELHGVSHVDASTRVRALTNLTVTYISLQKLNRMVQGCSALGAALESMLLIQRATQREWLLSLGYRTGTERMAHLVCELYTRMRLAGQADDDGCELAITQVDIAQALAITPVHVNRLLRELRERRLVTIRNRRLQIHDLAELARLSHFNCRYLLSGGEPDRQSNTLKSLTSASIASPAKAERCSEPKPRTYHTVSSTVLFQVPTGR